MAGSLSLRLRHYSLLRRPRLEHALARRFSPLDSAWHAGVVDTGCDSWHDDLPLSLLLAVLPGSRGGKGDGKANVAATHRRHFAGDRRPKARRGDRYPFFQY